ncbi:hypothetical protein AAHA92_05904 [Salvia divinorum]|uniref:Uncharacterized protein n=1 Tax=Salvia divinorum TaxID=28513 RepID=A0ABD1I400_SALDI
MVLSIVETDLHLDVKKNDEKAKKMQMQEDAVKNSPTVTGQNQEMVLPLFVRNVSWPDNPALTRHVEKMQTTLILRRVTRSLGIYLNFAYFRCANPINAHI